MPATPVRSPARRRAFWSEPHAVDTGLARLLPDPDRPAAWTLTVDGAPQSHVDLADPTHLEFEYVRRLGHVVDLAAPARVPVAAVHLGGGGLTLARYVAATRPGSRQHVVEVDAALTAYVRRQLPLDRSWRLRVRCLDARVGLARLRDRMADIIVTDVYAGTRAPAHLTSVEFAAEAVRVLSESGTYAVNVADGPPLSFARGQVATLRAVLPEVAMLAEPAVLHGRRFGNLVIVASRAPLPVAALVRRCAGDPAPSRVVAGDDLRRFAAGAVPVTDLAAVPSPAPPPALFARR